MPTYRGTKATWEMEKAAGSWSEWDTYEQYIEAEGKHPSFHSIKTTRGRRRADELTPEKVHQLFLSAVGLNHEPTKKDKAQCWPWGGTCLEPTGEPYFGQAQYVFSTKRARLYGFREFRGEEWPDEDDELASRRVFQFYSCPSDCANPWHAVLGSRTLARQS